MKTIRVALIQFDSIPEQTARNLAQIERLAEEAGRSDARWILFHEGTLSDYTPRVAELAEEVPGDSTRRIEQLARRLDRVISFGLTEKTRTTFHITQLFVGPQGLFYRYRKSWLWREPGDGGYRNEWARFDTGTGPELFELDGMQATCFICADGEAPRCIERAAQLKPQVVFYPNNRGALPDFPVFGERARRIAAPMLVTNRVGRSWIHDCQGGCVVYAATGEVLAQANREGREEILLHDLRIP